VRRRALEGGAEKRGGSDLIKKGGKARLLGVLSNRSKTKAKDHEGFGPLCFKKEKDFSRGFWRRMSDKIRGKKGRKGKRRWRKSTGRDQQETLPIYGDTWKWGD